jgi:hypothetical protein
MATTIKSSALDFNNIKSNLKDYLANKDEFKDYNFEASGLSNILDVLAYNTHLNALIANFALNESYRYLKVLDMFLIQILHHKQRLDLRLILMQQDVSKQYLYLHTHSLLQMLTMCHTRFKP